MPNLRTKVAQGFAVRVYKARLLDPAVPEQEALTYFVHISLIRALQLEGPDDQE